ncbi:unnamed protein product [Blepharisma stoltei]|uniref:Ycf1 n=1 Tax=Blepharisma stoltei TaxID=1481888 RepID=A0AAU9JQC4_9CILI|nr:unnamed protein product [Blepharisma stoltei]
MIKSKSNAATPYLKNFSNLQSSLSGSSSSCRFSLTNLNQNSVYLAQSSNHQDKTDPTRNPTNPEVAPQKPSSKISPQPGTIIRQSIPKSVALFDIPLFLWIDYKNLIQDYINTPEDYETTESLVVLDHHYQKHEGTASEYSAKNYFSPENFNNYLTRNVYIDKKPWLRSINILYKKENLSSLLELYQQINDTKYSWISFIKHQRKMLMKQQRLEAAARAEKDLEDQRELLQELSRINRPFLVSGKTGVKTSKHIVCKTKRKNQNIQKKLNSLEERSEYGEQKLEQMHEAWQKNVKKTTLIILSLNIKIRKSREKFLEIGLKSANRPLLFYIFSAMLFFTRISHEKTQVAKISSQSLKNWKKKRIFLILKDFSTKKQRTLIYIEKMKNYLKMREKLRILYYWKLFSYTSKVKNYYKRIANKFYQERLKTKKFYELKTETIINKGQRKRIKLLANGEEDGFSKDNVIIEQKHFLSVALIQIVKGLSSHQQRAFIFQQKLKTLEDYISNKHYLSLYAKEGNVWILRQKGLGEHRSCLELTRKPLFPTVQLSARSKNHGIHAKSVDDVQIIKHIHENYATQQKRYNSITPSISSRYQEIENSRAKFSELQETSELWISSEKNIENFHEQNE